MKKIFFIAATVLGIANLSAQEKTLAPQIGIKSSASMSSYNGKDISKTDYAVGFTAGLYGHFPLTESFAIQPEVNFARLAGKPAKNETLTTPLGSSRVKNITTLDYIQVPVMFKYYIAGTRINLEAGPQAGFLVYASDKNVTTDVVRNAVTGHNNVTTTEVKTDIKDNVQNFDFGVNYGIGYNLTDNINVGVRYYMGLTKIDKGQDGEKDLNIKNHSFSFGVGYSF